MNKSGEKTPLLSSSEKVVFPGHRKDNTAAMETVICGKTPISI